MPINHVKALIQSPSRRAAVILYGGAAFHFFYALFRFLTGILTRSYYFDAVAIFYLLLAFNRLVLIRTYRHRPTSCETHRILRTSGKLLFFTVGLFLFLIAETAAGNRRITSPRYIAIVSGAYAILSAALAVYELLYARRLGSRLLSASRTVSLTAALLSGYTFLSDLLFSLGAVLHERIRAVILLSVGAASVLLLLFLASALFHPPRDKKKRHLL